MPYKVPQAGQLPKAGTFDTLQQSKQGQDLVTGAVNLLAKKEDMEWNKKAHQIEVNEYFIKRAKRLALAPKELKKGLYEKLKADAAKMDAYVSPELLKLFENEDYVKQIVDASDGFMGLSDYEKLQDQGMAQAFGDPEKFLE